MKEPLIDKNGRVYSLRGIIIVRGRYLLIMGTLVMASFFVFKTTYQPVPADMRESREPSMVPGAEAVRPVAANQSLRVDALISDLAVPSPGSLGTTPAVQDHRAGRENEALQ